jgi:hypothetical protein
LEEKGGPFETWLALQNRQGLFPNQVASRLSSQSRAGNLSGEQREGKGIMSRCFVTILVCLSVVHGLSRPGACQTRAGLESYFRQNIGLKPHQVDDIRKGKPVVKVMKSRIPADIIVFGAVHINAIPESYIEFSNDFDRLRTLPIYLAIAKFSNPPAVSDLKGFSFGAEDVEELRSCKPGNCKIQLPAESMEAYQKSIDWNAPDIQERVNKLLRQRTIERLQAYQRDGNRALITYDDKDEPLDPAKQFEAILSYAQTLPTKLPDCRHYLLAYPDAKPANTQDMFYWTNEKFGLKPTLRVIHVVTKKGQSANEPAYAIAEKQLYASHYFQTALNITFLVRNTDTSSTGFYLLRAMGSTQAGLTGFKGSLIRSKAVKQAASFLEKWLEDLKNNLEKPGARSALH